MFPHPLLATVYPPWVWHGVRYAAETSTAIHNHMCLCASSSCTSSEAETFLALSYISPLTNLFLCVHVCVSCLCPPGKPLECFIGQYQGVQPIRLSSTASGKRPGQKQCCRFSPRLRVPPHTWGTALCARPYTTYEARKGATERLVPIPRVHSQPSLGCRDRVANTQASAGTVSSSGPAAMALLTYYYTDI